MNTENFITIEYHCKICKIGRVAQYDPVCPVKELENWRKSLVCDRCGDFENKHYNLRRAIYNSCISLVSVRGSAGKKLVEETERIVYDRLVALTKKMAKLVCDHYNVEFTWEATWPDDLMEFPKGCNASIKAYHAGIRRIAAS